MLGAVIGDIVGSKYEFTNHKSTKFPLFIDVIDRFTDDSVMTLSIASALLKCNGNYKNLSDVAIKEMQRIGRNYPRCGYGGRFYNWMFTDNPQPYNSCGNGSAMRVSACAWAARSLEEAKELSDKVTRISHNHPDGLKAAEATTVATYMALHGSSKEEIEEVVKRDYYNIDFTIDKIRPLTYHVETCEESVPIAFEAFFEGNSYEEVIRLAVSAGGDSDTIADIAGAMAEAYYGIPEEIRKHGLWFLDNKLRDIVERFEKKFGKK